MKIEITKNRISKHHIDIPIPYFGYTGDGKVYFKVISCKEAVQVDLYTEMESIMISNLDCIFEVFKDHKIITENEFNMAFEKAYEILKNKPIDTTPNDIFICNECGHEWENKSKRHPYSCDSCNSTKITIKTV